jgi:hypothetical protein
MDYETAMAVVRDNTLTYKFFVEAEEVHATSPLELISIIEYAVQA